MVKIVNEHLRLICRAEIIDESIRFIGCNGAVQNHKYISDIKFQYCDKHSINNKLLMLNHKNLTKDPELIGLKSERDAYRPSIWILEVENANGKKRIIQVGSNKNIFCTLENDIGIALEAIKNKNQQNKYYKLLSSDSISNSEVNRSLSFFEIDINLLLSDFKEDCQREGFWDNLNSQVRLLIDKGISSKYNDYHFIEPYDLLLKSCVEGLVAFLAYNEYGEDSSWMWSPSPDGHDGWFYTYFFKTIVA